MRILTLVSAVGAGLSAGVFFGFSTFVMAGLGNAPDAVGLRAMQEINRSAPTPLFMLALFGTGVLSIGLAIAAVVRRADGAGLLVAAAAVYLVAMLLTVAYHVPANDTLGALDPKAAGSAADWRDYLSQWTLVNHLRTLACVGGSVLSILAFRAQ